MDVVVVLSKNPLSKDVLLGFLPVLDSKEGARRAARGHRGLQKRAGPGGGDGGEGREQDHDQPQHGDVALERACHLSLVFSSQGSNSTGFKVLGGLSNKCLIGRTTVV